MLKLPLAAISKVTGRTAGATRWSCPRRAKAANRRELAVERAAKKDAVVALNEVFKTTNVAIVAHYSGLTVAQMQQAVVTLIHLAAVTASLFSSLVWNRSS